MASLLPRLLGAPSEAEAVARVGVVEAMREALGGFLSQNLEALIPSGAPSLQESSIVRMAQVLVWPGLTWMMYGTYGTPCCWATLRLVCCN